MKALKLFITVIILALATSSCLYDFIPPEEPAPDPNDPNAAQVSFSTDIQPIFTNNCVACHKTGGQMPDLSAGKAYAAINSSRYINTSSPDQSLIYLHPSPTTSTHTHKKYTATQAAIILTWITQGAKNN